MYSWVEVGSDRMQWMDDEATLTVVRFTLLGTFAHGAETQPREKEKVLFYR